jgi:hypothetical protein
MTKNKKKTKNLVECVFFDHVASSWLSSSPVAKIHLISTIVLFFLMPKWLNFLKIIFSWSDIRRLPGSVFKTERG